MPSPLRISGAPRSSQLDQDWSVALKNPNRQIPLKLTDDLKRRDPQAYALLASMKPDQLAALRSADTNSSGTLTLGEVKNFLMSNGRLKTGGRYDNFTDALNALFTKAAGKTVDVRAPNSSVLFLQVNNQTDRSSYLYNGNRAAAERSGLSNIVSKDPDKPELTGLDITKEFNKGPAEAQRAFRDGMQKYLDNLVKTGGTMSGLVISGHSNGTDMLFEHPHHAGYSAHLDIRAELKRFKEMESPPGSGKFPYKKIFEQTEKVGLLACFQGGNLHEWRELFPNAVLAGTQNFSPDAGSRASPAIYGAAAKARQFYEDGGDFNRAEAVGRTASGARTDGLQSTRGLKLSVPLSPAARLQQATTDFDRAKAEYATAAADIEKALRDGQGAVSPDRMRVLYRIARTFEGSASALKAAGGTPKFADGRPVDVANQTRIADRLFQLRF